MAIKHLKHDDIGKGRYRVKMSFQWGKFQQSEMVLEHWVRGWEYLEHTSVYNKE